MYLVSLNPINYFHDDDQANLCARACLSEEICIFITCLYRSKVKFDRRYSWLLSSNTVSQSCLRVLI